MMLLPRLLSLVSWLACVATAYNMSVDCSDSGSWNEPPCTQPVDGAVDPTPGAFYIAKLQCFDCPYHEWQGTAPNREYKLVFGDVGLVRLQHSVPVPVPASPKHPADCSLVPQFFNITLSHNRRSILLNGQAVFPKLQTIPKPPSLWIPQIRPDFSYRNLSSTLACRRPQCLGEDSRTMIADSCKDWCHELQLDTVDIEYLYIMRSGTKYDGKDWDSDAQLWEFAIDAIGTHPGYLQTPSMGFDNPSQKMLKVIVEGKEVGDGHKGKKEAQGGGDPFHLSAEKVYDYSILEVSMADREFKFPARKSLSLREKVSRFFGNDVWQEQDHRLVFLHGEWGVYGKEGTLRNIFGEMIHWSLWPLVWLIVASVIGGLTVLFGMYKLFYWIQAQRRLMKWNGMDDVWDNLRREREEEENRLLDGNYRDEPDEEASSRPSMYRDDVDTMKPLPAKPLPDKPLPEVPLIDA
jgi:hypothetical protein